MRYDQNFVDQMLKVDQRNDIPLEETLLKLARYYEREEAWLAAVKERNQGSIFRRSGKDLLTLLFQVCDNEEEEKLLLDEKSPGMFGKKRTTDQWIDYYNKGKDGRVMASMDNLYTGFKLLRSMYERGTTERQAIARRYLDNLRKDFLSNGEKGGLTCSTRLFYSRKDLSTKIVHHYRCRRPELTTETTIEVPVYRNRLIEEITIEEKGLAYLQASFGTQDDGETIIKTIEFVSGKNRNNIVGWTANNTTSDTRYPRASFPERAVWLYISSDGFVLICGNYPIDSLLGRARGVQVM